MKRFGRRYKNELTPWHCIPPEGNAAFAVRMEDVLDVYERPEDGKRSLVCMDECPRQLAGEERESIPPQPGEPERYDTEYVRNGTRNLFMFTAPLVGWRRVKGTERRTRMDWVRRMQRLADGDVSDAGKAALVMDNLNTHRPASPLRGV
jgi:hypothetical protein